MRGTRGPRLLSAPASHQGKNDREAWSRGSAPFCIEGWASDQGEEETTMQTACRGIRGAITVDADRTVRSAIAELLDAIREKNGVRTQDVAAAVFTVTEDLRGENPAAAARGAGWHAVPL